MCKNVVGVVNIGETPDKYLWAQGVILSGLQSEPIPTSGWLGHVRNFTVANHGPQTGSRDYISHWWLRGYLVVTKINIVIFTIVHKVILIILLTKIVIVTTSVIVGVIVPRSRWPCLILDYQFWIVTVFPAQIPTPIRERTVKVCSCGPVSLEATKVDCLLPGLPYMRIAQ